MEEIIKETLQMRLIREIHAAVIPTEDAGKRLKYLVIHSTATPEGRTVSRQDIEKWHYGYRGWSRLGYSDMIHLDGSLENLTPYNSDNIVQNHEMTWGAAGINSISRHLVYVGGTDRSGNAKDTRTSLQKATMEAWVKIMLQMYPDVKVSGHRQHSATACPSFDVPSWAESVGIPDERIYRS